ncbi:hypothetical protein EVAR_63848_1 [Eumeta japonica]|uniref:Uncharacterized protein n=1 Tax=Eumeta variegata TaxID=151549 RepID=A0A4C1Z3B5_EUMVA|nr:hypothetical protein EVAR_63848_1 [Eumeta japonica]
MSFNFFESFATKVAPANGSSAAFPSTESKPTGPEQIYVHFWLIRRVLGGRAGAAVDVGNAAWASPHPTIHYDGPLHFPYKI